MGADVGTELSTGAVLAHAPASSILVDVRDINAQDII